MLGTLMMKAASKREQCQVLLGHCRARAGSTEGQCNKIADEISDVARMQIKEIDDMYSSEYSLQWIYEDIIKSFIHRYKTTK